MLCHLIASFALVLKAILRETVEPYATVGNDLVGKTSGLPSSVARMTIGQCESVTPLSKHTMGGTMHKWAHSLDIPTISGELCGETSLSINFTDCCPAESVVLGTT